MRTGSAPAASRRTSSPLPGAAASPASGPGDGPAADASAPPTCPTRWAFYREHRIDGQIDYFADRAERHRRAARRWYWIRLVLTVSTVAVAAVSLACRSRHSDRARLGVAGDQRGLAAVPAQ